MMYLRWVMLLPSLLFVGLLGGLLAPFPTEAAAPSTPTVTLRMDSGPTITIGTTLSSCPAGDITLGYNYCYAVATGQTVGTAPKQFQVQANGTPRLRIADKNGQDKMSLTGVRFVPVGSWPNTESHTLTLTVSGTLNATTDGASGSTINTNNAGLYKWALRSAGEFNANSGSDAVGNSVVLTGKGTFSAANQNKAILSTSGTKNLTPLSFTINGPAATADINWGGVSNTDMGQVDPSYPQFDCRGGYAGNTVTTACRPTITQTLTATIKGMDTLKVLSGPLDLFGAHCDETFSAEQTKQIKFLKAVVNGLKFLLPQIRKPDLRTKISELISKLEAILVTTTTPSSDPTCKGAQVLAFNMALEQAVDGLIIASDNSSPGVPAPLHYYAVINAPGLTWEAARTTAQGLGSGGNVCDLATITSSAEQAIIAGLLPDPSSFPAEPAQDYWIGGFQLSGSSEPDGGWHWINDEGMFWNNGPVADMFANWGSGEPNNLSGNEHHLTVDHRFLWGWNDLNTDGANGTTKGYITEGTTGLCVPPVID
jgi:hypothetical protein